MTKKPTTAVYSLTEIMKTQSAVQDDLASAPEAESLPPGFWDKAQIVLPDDRKVSIHLRVDPDVLAWFRGQGKGHLSRMNAVLRSYMEAHSAPPK